MRNVGLIDMCQIILDKIIENGGESFTKTNMFGKTYTIVKLSKYDPLTIYKYFEIGKINPKKFADGLMVNNYTNYICSTSMIKIYH